MVDFPLMEILEGFIFAYLSASIFFLLNQLIPFISNPLLRIISTLMWKVHESDGRKEEIYERGKERRKMKKERTYVVIAQHPPL
jgi:hypothetical protein